MRKLFFTPVVVGASAHASSRPNDGATTTTVPAHDTTANTPIGTLAADPAAKAIVEQYIPGLVIPQTLPLVSHTSLKGIQGYG